MPEGPPGKAAPSARPRGRRAHNPPIPSLGAASTPLCEEIIRRLREGYECMICCEAVTHRQPVWGCPGCFKLFHLPCVKRWAKGAAFRCPACQTSHPEPPTQYRCFCGKVRDPEHDPYGLPHSCGSLCDRGAVRGRSARRLGRRCIFCIILLFLHYFFCIILLHWEH